LLQCLLRGPQSFFAIAAIECGERDFRVLRKACCQFAQTLRAELGERFTEADILIVADERIDELAAAQVTGNVMRVERQISIVVAQSGIERCAHVAIDLQHTCGGYGCAWQPLQQVFGCSIRQHSAAHCQQQ
jgi:hypothetical protein